jgi:hypothetical protein
MTALYALYESPEAAQGAVDRLRAIGVPHSEITILSSEPFHAYEFGQGDGRTVMPWVAVLGGVAGFATGASLTSLTQLDWPIVTGGMPIVSVWPNLIPTFELTMLGAVLATVVTLLVSAFAPGRRSRIYDLQISEGKILVGVEHQEHVPSADLERTLQKDGQIKWLP